MGNSLSITPNSSEFKGSPLLELQADGTIDNKHQGNILRKHIYDVLMNRKENVNGNTVDVNKSPKDGLSPLPIAAQIGH